MAVQYYVASTLDGFIADQDDDVGWLEKLEQPTKPTYESFLSGVGALAMGAATYEFLLRHIEGGGEWPYEQPTWVFTNRAFPAREGVTFVSGAVSDVHADMARAAGAKNIWVVGGGDLAGQFHDAGLLDELIVSVASLTLGAGKPLLPRRINALRLVNAESMGSGFAELRYAIVRE